MTEILIEGVDVSFDAMTTGAGHKKVVPVLGNYPSERLWDRVMRFISGTAAMLTNIITTSTCSANSTSSVAIGTGSNRTFDVGTGKAFMPTQILNTVKTSDPSNFKMLVSVVSYSGSTLIVSPISAIGSGTHTDWSIFPQQGDVSGIASSTSSGLIKWLNTSGKALAAVAGWSFDGSDNLQGSGKEIKDVLQVNVRDKKQDVTAAGTLAIDWSLGSVINLTHGVNITALSFTNIPSTGCSFLEIYRKKDASVTTRTSAWPAAVKWDGSAPPALTQTTGAVDRIILRTFDGGTTIYGSSGGSNFG